MVNKKRISEVILKKRIIRRIKVYSEIYTHDELENLNYHDLKKLQRSLFIQIHVSQKFRNRKRV